MEIETLNSKIQKLADLRAKESELSMQKKQVADEVALAEGELIEILQSQGMSNYRAPAGMVVLSVKSSVRTPKSEEDRKAFFEYLKEKGLYDSMIGVNSMTLNSFYKNMQKEYTERGEEMPKIPGLGEVTDTPSLSFRR